MTESLVSGNSAVPLSIRATAVVASAVLRAVRQLLTDLERGRRVDTTLLRGAVQAAFRVSDATEGWNWKIAYDVCEAATVLFLRRSGFAIRAKATLPAIGLPMLIRIASLFPRKTHGPDERESREQCCVHLDRTLDHLSKYRALLVINECSGRAAIKIAAASFRTDDEEIEQHIRLVRAMDHRCVPLNMMGRGYWAEGKRECFAAVELAKFSELPDLTASAICLIELPVFMCNCFEPDDIFHEIIACKSRLFGPSGASGVVVLAKVLDHPTIKLVAKREAV